MTKQIPTDRTITYVPQYRTCGSPGCICARDKSKRHGPYWYGYWRENGKLTGTYVRKVLPGELQKKQKAIENVRVEAQERQQTGARGEWIYSDRSIRKTALNV